MAPARRALDDMRIAIDTRAYFQRTGIARYTRGLVEALVDGNRRDDYLLLISDHHRAEDLPITAPRVEVQVSTAEWLGGRAERRRLAEEVHAWRADVFHSVFPPIAIPGIPSLITAFDLTPLSHPQFHQSVIRRTFRTAITQAVPQAASVLAISDATARQVEARFPDVALRTRVVGCGLSPWFLEPPPTANRRKGVLFVGTIEPRKNVPLVVETARRLALRGYRDPMTIVGKPGWGGYDVPSEIGALPRVRYLGYVTDEKLRALYRRAAIFLYPSAVEGFGLPVLEAMAQGALPLISPDPALQEVVRDRSLLIDSADPDKVADAVVRWSSDLEGRERKVERLARRARRTTWHRAARSVRRVYRELR